MTTRGPSGPSILLVDDTPANLLALSAVLEKLDVRMVEARSGAEALEHVEREAFAVVLLDVQMGDMDGFETARRMRALPLGREVPIVFLTAIHQDEAYAKRGYANGAADYITKPFDVVVLRARVRAFVDLYRQRDTAHHERWERSSRELGEAQRRLEASELERERLLERERAAHEAAEIANRTKDEFLATVSHELRTPLNAILGWTSSVRRGVVTDVERALAIIERNARAQARIVEDVLDLSRIVTGKLRLEVVPTELSQAVYGAVEAVRPAAEAKGVTLEGYVDRPLGFVPADADRIQQVVWNLVSNAVKFSARGGRVLVNAANEGQRVAIRVRDSGQGIEPGFLPYVFEPFRQADASATRRHGGLGLGLAIVKQLVHAHGGSVRAESEGVGKGSTFVVELPVRAVPDTFRLAAGEGDVGSWVEGLSKVRVLVVDDEEDSRVLVAQVLAQHGAIVDVVDSAVAALQRISIARPHVIVSDIAMPKTDGYSLIRSLRRLPPEAGGTLPAIALTAHARSEDRARVHAAGFQMHLPKPVEMSRLLAGVAELAGVHD